MIQVPTALWEAFDYLIATSKLIIDRPKNTPHPKFPELIYPLDYGYLEGTSAGDGDGIDVWLGSSPGTDLVGLLCTVDVWKRDTEVKLLIDCNQEDRAKIFKFLNEDAELPCAVVLRGNGVS